MCVTVILVEGMKRIFFLQSLIAYVLGMVRGIFFEFGMWLPLSGGHLHSKFGLDITELHMHENRDFVFSCQYTYTVVYTLFSCAAYDITVCLDYYISPILAVQNLLGLEDYQMIIVRGIMNYENIALFTCRAGTLAWS